MLRIKTRLAALLLVVAAPALAGPAPVRVEGGNVQGISQGPVDVWLGIPYAAPPVGDLRWRAPQPVKPWRKTRAADTYGPSCYQPSVEPVSEDCLTVNVYRPKDAKGPLPVMVWIHGGAFVRGGSKLYPMQGLAAQGIVGVSLNYRLGRLGFFAHPAVAEAGAVRGNYGYLDQLAALKWVQANITAFGGDPKSVTIFGESAGGCSVATHVASPMSRGLFVRAIVESGCGGRASVLPYATLDKAEKIAVDYAKLLGIDGTDAASARKLRALSPGTLVAGASGEEVLAALATGTIPPGVSLPIIDGILIPENVSEIFKVGKQNKVPIIIGSNSADLGLGVADSKQALFGQLGKHAIAAAKAYDPDGTRALDELKAQVFGEKYMIEPARHLADMAAASGQNAWLYRYSYVPTVQRVSMPGTLHGMEIPYVFNIPGAIIGPDKTTDEDRAMAKTTSAYWVRFAKTGDPNGDGLPEWPKHTSGSDMLLNFTNEGVKLMQDPRADSIALWREHHDPER